jgi:hypothetical protein
MPRVLVLCRNPPHLRPDETKAWLEEEVETLLYGDPFTSVVLTRLEEASPQWAREFDWLIELGFEGDATWRQLGLGGGCGALVADLRLLGMGPVMALANEREAVELRSP